MAELSELPDESFGMVFCALSSWSHILDPDHALAVLREARRVLRPAGLLVLDLEDPAQHAPGRGELVLAGFFEDGADLVTKTVAVRADGISPVEDVTVIWDRVRDGRVRRTVWRAGRRVYSQGELGQLLARSGLQLEEWLGNWDLDPYGGQGNRMIAVAARR